MNNINLMNTIETEAWILEQTDSCQRGGRLGDQMKEGEGIKQKTCTYNTQTQTAVW